VSQLLFSKLLRQSKKHRRIKPFIYRSLRKKIRSNKNSKKNNLSKKFKADRPFCDVRHPSRYPLCSQTALGRED